MELGQNIDAQSRDTTRPHKIIPSPAATVRKDIRGVAMQWTCGFKVI